MTEAGAGIKLDVGPLDDWIGDRLPGAGQPLTAARLGADAGIGNALYLLDRGRHRWVLRRPPAIKNHPSAANTEREWRILHALEGSAVPHPEPLLFCDDPSVIGTTFMIMSVIDGFTPAVGIPAWIADDADNLYALGMAYVDALVELQKVDWATAGLADLGKPEGFLERQVSRWMGQLEGYRVRELPEEAFLTDWLERNRPSMSPAAILHGDFSPFNVMVANDPPVRLAAVIDWDTATIGDPLLDIGHLLARWAHHGELHPLGHEPQPQGSPTRADMAARYAERSGRDLTALAYYEALSLFKLGIILEGSYARAVAAGEPSRTAQTVPALFRVAAAFARGERS